MCICWSIQARLYSSCDLQTYLGSALLQLLMHYRSSSLSYSASCRPLYLSFPSRIMKLNKLRSRMKTEAVKKNRCSKIHLTLTDSFKDKIICKFYFVQYLLKRFLLSILLILVDSGKVQIAFFIILNVLSWVYWVALRPYKKTFYNIVLWINEAVFLLTGFLMIAFLNTQQDFSTIGIVLIALFTINLIGLFIWTTIYELIGLIKYIKENRTTLRSDMKVVKPKMTKRIELNRQKMAEALPQIDGNLTKSLMLQLYFRPV